MTTTQSMILSLFFLAFSAAAQSKPDFSGDWSLNKEKSKLQLQQLSSMEKATVTVEHHEPLFKFRRTFTIEGKENSLSFELKTDGKEVERDEGARHLISRLTWEGDILVFATRIVAPQGEATNIVRYSLREGGRLLQAEEKFRGPVLSYDNLWVFEKQ